MKFVAVTVLVSCGLVTAQVDECETGSYHDVDSGDCKYCMNVPLNGYYTGNGNFTNVCPYEICETCPNGEFNNGCGYDDQTKEPPSVCFSMTDYADICSAGPVYCTVVPTDYTAYDSCDAYCEDQVLTCLASYTSDGGCGDSVDDLTEGSCSDSMTEDTVCACHLTTCEDALTAAIKDCAWYDVNDDYCPSHTTVADLENQIWATQQCRATCGACVNGESFGAGECKGCSEIAEDSVGVFYSSDGDRSDSCDVSDCSQECFLGEYNAGCGYNDFKEDTFACALCQNTCGEGNYISNICDGSGFSDVTECSACSGVCGIGFYIGNVCDGTTTYDSTECFPCTATCNPGSYIDGEICTGYAYESQAECVACTSECPEGYFPDGSCDGAGTSDTVECKDCLTQCNKECEDCDCFEACFTVTVLGGSDNWALNTFDAVGGGASNQAGYLEVDASGMGETDEFNVVIGGFTNTAGGTYSAITGGEGNIAFGVGNTVTGGSLNTAASADNDGFWQISVDAATVGGGTLNTASADYATILGGSENVASATYSGVVAGTSNVASGSYSNIIGGDQNSVRGSWAGVGGGKLNKAWANYATCPGGYVGKASARFSVVLGGSRNTAKGRYSLAAGFKAKASKDYSATLGFSGSSCDDNGSGTFSICADYVFINGYDVTDLLATASGARHRKLSDGSEKHLGEDAELRRLVRDMGYTMNSDELTQELNENHAMLKSVDDKMEQALSAMQDLERTLQPSSLRSH